MDEKSYSSYDYLKNNIYNHMKEKLLLFQIKAEYNMVLNFLYNPNTMRMFFMKEINNNDFFYATFLDKRINHQTKNDYNYLVILDNINKKETDIFIVKSIYRNICYNHFFLILRFIKVESFNDNIENYTLDNVIDLNISFYINIDDNSTIIINDFFSQLSDLLLRKFNSIVLFFNKKLQSFVKEKMNKFYCIESILINYNMDYIFNYLLSCQIFHNEKFKIKKIERKKDRIIISCRIGTLFPGNNCESKLAIMNISNHNSIINILNLINNSDFEFQEKFLNTKTYVSIFLQKLRAKINNDNIDKNKEEIQK